MRENPLDLEKRVKGTTKSIEPTKNEIAAWKGRNKMMNTGEQRQYTPEEKVVEYEKALKRADGGQAGRMPTTRPLITPSMNLKVLLEGLEKEMLVDTVAYRTAKQILKRENKVS